MMHTFSLISMCVVLSCKTR